VEPVVAQPKSSRMILIAVGAAIFVIGAILAVYFLLRPANVTRVPAAATGQVAVDQANVMSDPSDSANIIVTVKRGVTVNVIRPPHSRNQDWTEVQVIAAGHVYPAGVIRTSQLNNWASPKSDIAWSLIVAFAPPDGAPDSDLQDYAQKLRLFLQNFPGTPDAAQARGELDRVTQALTHSAPPASNAPPVAAPVTRPSPPSVPARPNVTPPALRPAPAGADPAASVAQAKRYWENGDYANAERILNRLLQQQPDYAPARQLLDRVERAKKLEGK
jgi:hypothetical protein